VRAAVETTETTQENIQDWLELEEGDPGFQVLTEEVIAAVIFFYLFSSALPIILHFSFICFLFLSYRAKLCFTNAQYCIIRMTCYQLARVYCILLHHSIEFVYK
jgi:hypothetical protein